MQNLIICHGHIICILAQMCEFAQNLGKLKSVKIMQTSKVTILDFSREIEVGPKLKIKYINKSDNFLGKLKSVKIMQTSIVTIFDFFREISVGQNNF